MTVPVPTAVPHRFSEDLNYSQYAAVTHPCGPLLVLAGPGTGKTRVLTYRVAWLLDQGVPASAILMATFSCSAAEEMLKRALELAGRSLSRGRKLRGGTFHSIACSFLRQYGSHIGLSPKFVI
jgi:DNA helicase-2/ATP-dependent DNA helicase PcrA